MPRWEYRVVNLLAGLEGEVMEASLEKLETLLEKKEKEDGKETTIASLCKEIEERLNSYGEKEWELASLENATGFAIFKREKK